ADRQLRERLAVCRGELDLRAARVQIQAGAILVADRLALADLEVDELQAEFAHPGDVRGEVAPLGDDPAVALALERERRLRLGDLDRRDVGDLDVEERLAERRRVVGLLRAFLIVVEERAAAERDEQHYQDECDTRVHASPLIFLWVLRRMSATPRPK